jgi:peptidyl-prolyl cis-trans isomerase SurA
MKNTHFVLPCLFILFLLFSSKPSAPTILEKVVCRVNDDVITLHDLESQENLVVREIYRSYKGKDLDKAVRDAKAQVLQTLIDETLLLQKGKDLGYEASDARVDDVIEAIKKQNKIETDEQFEQALAEEGVTLDTVRETTRKRIVIDAVKRSEIGGRIIVADRDVEEYYDKHKEDYMEDEQVRLQEIVLTGEGDAPGDVEKEANQLYQLIMKGTSFPELAIFFSQAPTAEHGGDMGFLKVSDLTPEIQELLKTLKVGEVAKPLKTAYGVHIIKLLDRKEKTYKPMADVRDQIIGRLKSEKFDGAYEKYMKELREKSFVDCVER